MNATPERDRKLVFRKFLRFVIVYSAFVDLRAKEFERELCRPYGTRRIFLSYPALRLQLRAGLDYFAPMALRLRLFLLY
jgi:hypothetical protein